MTRHHCQRGMGPPFGMAMDSRKGNQRLPGAAFSNDGRGSRPLPAPDHSHGRQLLNAVRLAEQGLHARASPVPGAAITLITNEAERNTGLTKLKAEDMNL